VIWRSKEDFFFFKQERLESCLATKRNDQIEMEILILEKKEGLNE